MGLFGRTDGWGVSAVTCDSGSILGCTIASFPLIIGGLAALVLLLLGLRFALSMREGWRRTPEARPEPKPARQVTPGSPLHPPPASETPQKPKAPQPRPPAKPTPLQLSLSDPPDLSLADFQGDNNIQGDFGEVMTAVVLGAQGWKQLPSKLQGRRGIDGLFVREVRGGGGYECLATETKTNSGGYEPKSMTDEKLAADIAALYEVGALSKTNADELLRALDQGASFFRKELWRHDLSNGMTTINELGRKGEKGRSVTRSNARLMAALHMSLERFDRRSVYLGRPPVDDEA
mgnify:CR=1 FL=1